MPTAPSPRVPTRSSCRTPCSSPTSRRRAARRRWASGGATLLLHADEQTAVLRSSYSNLSGPLTAAHIHAPDGQILFDLDDAPLAADGSRVWTIEPAGTWTRPQILAALRAGQCYLNLHTANYPNGEIKGFFRAGRAAARPSRRRRRRRRCRAACRARPTPPASSSRRPTGRRTATIAAAPGAGLRGAGSTSSSRCRSSRTWPTSTRCRRRGRAEARARAGVVLEAGGPGAGPAPPARRLRALARSSSSPPRRRRAPAPSGIAAYIDLLARNAFGNFRELLEEVTLRPAMGVYLDMRSNDKEDPETGPQPQRELSRARSCSSSRSASTSSTPTARCSSTPGPADPDLRPGRGQGLRARLHRLDASPARTAPRSGASTGRERELAASRWRPGPSTTRRAPSSCSTASMLPAGQSAQADLDAGARQHLPPPQRRAVRLPPADPAAGDEQPEPGLRLPLRAGVRQQRRGCRAATCRRSCAPILLDYEARSTELSTQPGLRPAARAGGAHGGAAARARARSRRADGRFRYYWQASAEWGLSQSPLQAPTVFNFFEPDLRAARADRRRPGSSRRSSRSPPRRRSSAPRTSCTRCSTGYADDDSTSRSTTRT